MKTNENYMSKWNQEEYNLLKSILKPTQEQLHSKMYSVLTNAYPGREVHVLPNKGMYVEGDIPVLLVAHMDTVHLIQPTEENIFYDREKQVIWSPNGIGADCRAGIYNIVSTLKKGYRPHVMVTWEEERGGIGATAMCKEWGAPSSTEQALKVQESMSKVNFAVQYDRHGIDEAVYYYLDNQEFEDYISTFGYQTKVGSYTDICEICPTFGFAGVNVAAGYLDEHTKHERLLVDEMMKTQARVIEILEDQQKESKFFEYKEIAYSRYSSYGSYGNGGYSYGYGTSTYGSGWGDLDDWGQKDSKTTPSYSSKFQDAMEDIWGLPSAPTKCYLCEDEFVETNYSDVISETEDLFMNNLCHTCRGSVYGEEAVYL